MEQQKKEVSLKDILYIVAPGSPLRQGMDNVLRANTGGLIVIGYSEKVKKIVNGGFQLNCSFSPSFLYELSKMDGAIILNGDVSKILYANTQLTPDPAIETSETGMRHRTAERVAKQTGHLVIAISERRNVITLYQGNFKYSLQDMGMILTKANQALQTLEKYKNVYEQSITNLGALELEELVTFYDVVQVIHQIEIVLRIKNEILSYVDELGTEGKLIQMQMDELVSNIDKEAKLLIKDYAKDPTVSVQKLLDTLKKSMRDELLEDQTIMKLLGYSNFSNLRDEIVAPKGYRILHKIPHLPSSVIDNIVESFESINNVTKATTDELDEVEGIGEVRARKVKEGLKRIEGQLFFERHV